MSLQNFVLLMWFSVVGGSEHPKIVSPVAILYAGISNNIVSIANMTEHSIFLEYPGGGWNRKSKTINLNFIITTYVMSSR